MQIFNSEIVRTNDPGQFAWSGLRRFQHIAYVEDILMRLHNLPSSARQNVRKQATQIRYCLLQAREYADAATTATLATKPNLLYYSAMSLALAEILFKQDGRSSLDAARANHRHHGLELVVSGPHGSSLDISRAAEGLKSKPMIRETERIGTFELWHRTAREMPLVGEVTTYHSGSFTRGHGAVLFPDDIGFPKLPAGGLSLLDCLLALPGMRNLLRSHGVRHGTIRGDVKTERRAEGKSNKYILTIHPDDPGLIELFFENCIFHPSAVMALQFNQMPCGGQIIWPENVDAKLIHQIPHGAMANQDDVYFWPTIQPLNEFGFMYVALHITGNYARYFPDRWVADVEKATPLALAVEELMRIVTQQMPLLTLSELSRTYFVLKD